MRPLLILTNGYDGVLTDMYFASAVAATRRGYHCLVFDGPGQGGMLYEQGVTMRPDWETVVAAVVDFALTQPHRRSRPDRAERLEPRRPSRACAPPPASTGSPR